MWVGRRLDPDRVARPYVAAFQHHGHDAGLANQIAVRGTLQGRFHQTGLNAIELGARVAQTGHLDHRHITKMEAGTGRQPPGDRRRGW